MVVKKNHIQILRNARVSLILTSGCGNGIPAGKIFLVLRNKNPVHERTPIKVCETHQHLASRIIRITETEEQEEEEEEECTVDGLPTLVWVVPEGNEESKVNIEFSFTCSTLCSPYTTPHSMWDFSLYYCGEELSNRVVLYKSPPIKVVEEFKASSSSSTHASFGLTNEKSYLSERNTSRATTATATATTTATTAATATGGKECGCRCLKE